MQDVLVVYKQVSMQFDENGNMIIPKDGMQTITLSLLAAIDLLTGEDIALVSETHKSSDFVVFLKKIDEHYPTQDKIRMILDNHSAHTSKETRNLLSTMPAGR